MVVCVCNNINDEKIKDQVKKGSKNIKEIYDELQCGDRCGKCVPEIKKILRSNNHDIISYYN